jgi:hypothetical protein
MANEAREFRPRQRRLGEALKPFPLPEFLQKMLDRGKAEMAKPFVGITTDGKAIPGLFPLAATGPSLENLVDAADTFLGSLAADQRAACSFELETGPWRAWHNMHGFLIRHGALLDTMTVEQRERALDLLRASMSAAGFQTARDVM